MTVGKGLGRFPLISITRTSQANASCKFIATFGPHLLIMAPVTTHSANTQPIKCACATCHCIVQPGKGYVRDGKIYCSQACAFECTETTCVCVHDRCEEKHQAD